MSEYIVIAVVVAAFIAAGVLSYLFTPPVKRFAQKIGAIDVPKDNRRMHKEPIPRLGGLAIFGGFLCSILVFGQLDQTMLCVLLGASIIVALGIFDDVLALGAKLKFVVQIVAAAIPVCVGDLQISLFTNLNPFSDAPYFHLGIFAIPVTIIWIVGITNAVNLIDGLDGLAVGVSSIAAITNLTPNHLDYHKNFAEYVQAKTSIYTHQVTGERLVLNGDDPVTRTLDIGPGHQILTCSKIVKPENGVYLRDGVIYIAEQGKDRALMDAKDIRIPGAHNVYNVMMAAAIVQGLCQDDDIVEVAKTFGGVEHRIEFVREFEGVKYYNDSIASSPTRTIAGLESFDQKLILIAGGYDKHIPYDVLGVPICRHVKTLLLTGATAPKIRACVEQADCPEKPEIIDVPDLAAAVRCANAVAQPGDIVIMSPASASFDCFKNFMERGNLFKELVHKLV